MRSKFNLLIAGALGVAMIGLAGCFDEPGEYGWGPARQSHEQREFNYGPKHEVCDANGYNCMVCDADNDYCRRLSSGYGRYYGPNDSGY